MAQFVSRDPACAFDSAEQNALENTIRKLHREIDAENFDVVSQNIGELRDRIRIHLDKTVEWKNGQIRIAAHWREMLLERETELSTLLNDEAVSKWARPELELGGEQLSEIKDFLEKSEFVEIERRLAGWDESLASLLKEIEEVQLKEAQRQFIVDGFKNILGKMGFVDVHASLENGENPFSATIIEARRDPGKTLSILVPQKEGGDIRYVVDGYDKRQRYHQGSLYRTCDEAQAQLQGFHDQLKEVGIEMSTLTWREMPPHDLEAAADSLPREQAKTFSNER